MTAPADLAHQRVVCDAALGKVVKLLLAEGYGEQIIRRALAELLKVEWDHLRREAGP